MPISSTVMRRSASEAAGTQVALARRQARAANERQSAERLRHLTPDPTAPVQPSARIEPGPPPVRVAALAGLVDRIERLAKSQRPALAVTLLGARVEIERTAPGAVAMSFRGWRSPAALLRLKRELEARGVKLACLKVG